MDPTMPELSATLPVFDHNLSIVHYVNMPTLLLCENTGTREYVASLNRPRSMQRSRYVARRLHYFFCPDFFENDGAEGSCPHGQQCQDVHIIPAWVLSSQEIHVNTPQRSNIHNRARLSPGEQICVHKMDAKMQNGVWYNSDQILVTKGSADVAGGNSGTRRVFHCKHFYNNKMCIRGPKCVFLHVVESSDKRRTNRISDVMNARSSQAVPLCTTPSVSLSSSPVLTGRRCAAGAEIIEELILPRTPHRKTVPSLSFTAPHTHASIHDSPIDDFSCQAAHTYPNKSKDFNEMFSTPTNYVPTWSPLTSNSSTWDHSSQGLSSSLPTNRVTKLLHDLTEGCLLPNEVTDESSASLSTWKSFPCHVRQPSEYKHQDTPRPSLGASHKALDSSQLSQGSSLTLSIPSYRWDQNVEDTYLPLCRRIL